MREHAVWALALTIALMVGCGGTGGGTPGADYSSLRETPSGAIVGFTNEYGSHSYLGIPFAEAPVGAERWRAPRAVPRAKEPRQALRFGSSCVQFANPLGGDQSAEAGTLVGDEDCLFLNVYAPKAETNEAAVARRPVLVWIHGGGNTIGTSSFYHGGRLAAEEGAVVVTINYRLGPFGWFRHPSLAETASPTERSGNFAVLDMIAALDWVRENIGPFGGDPGNVTIFGESAGGQDVLLLLTSPLARGLFHRAISQSGGTWMSTIAEAENLRDADEPGLPTSSAEITLAALVAEGRAAGLAEARELSPALSPAETDSLLRGIAANELMAIYDDLTGGRLGQMPKVFPDGLVLPAEGTRAALERPGRHADVPILLGTNRDENKLFLYFNPEIMRHWFGLYPTFLNERRFEMSAEYLSRHWRATGSDEIAEALAAQHPGRVFGYRFDWDEEPSVLGIDLGRLLGAAHGFEIPFVFGHWDLGPQTSLLFDDDNLAAREILSRQMRSYWVEFATRGDPGRGVDQSLPAWGAWGPGTTDVKWLRLDTPDGGGLQMEREVVTAAQIEAQLRTDERLDDALRCQVAADLDEWAELETAGIPGLDCPDSESTTN